jgi:chemotaxis protein methyltransferase WspC
MAECGFSNEDEDADAYLRRLEVSPETWEDLVEQVVVPETWFFRDGEPFVFLGDHVMPHWMKTWGRSSAGRSEEWKPVFRVLSVPCATGEEPYSIAMTLLDRGVAPDMFQIDAIDISAKVLEKSRQAVYGKASFRGTSDLGFRDRYFRETPDARELVPHVRERVCFFQANVLAHPLPVEGNRYDAIFCRNLLIYFDASARERTIQVLKELLSDEGVLFVGHAEAMIMMQSGFVSMDHPRAFAFRRGPSATCNGWAKSKTFPKPTSPGGTTAASHKVASRERRRRSSACADRSPYVQSPPAVGPAPGETAIRPALAEIALAEIGPEQQEISTAQVRRLADAGHLEMATAMCEQLVARRQASAECFSLLGLISEASGDWTKAEQWFDKALYMNPQYEEALVHLTLILDRRGDHGRAAAMHERMRRIEQGRSDEIA